jgi:plasmid stabilization system protein ParE
MRVRFEPDAAEELAEATSYLADRSPHAAERFLADIAGAKTLLLQFPNVGSPIRGNLRRLLLRIFPYQLIYSVDGGETRIHAVAHLKRKPEYWRKRIPR